MAKFANELFKDYIECYFNGWTEERLSEHPLTKSRNIYFHARRENECEAIAKEGLQKGPRGGIYLANNLSYVLHYARLYFGSKEFTVVAVNFYDYTHQELSIYREYKQCDKTIFYPFNLDLSKIISIASYDLSILKG